VAGEPAGAVFSSRWDSVRQRALLASYAPTGHGIPVERVPSEGRAELLGQLRWQVVQGRTVFLSYAQLLDGAAFAALRPAELLDELAIRTVGGGATLPLRVNSRGADLAGQLVAMLSKGFLLSSLPLEDAQRRRLQRELAARAETWTGAAARSTSAGERLAAVDRMLADTGVLEPPLRRRLCARWGDWIGAAERGELEVSPLVPADFAGAYAIQPPPRPDLLRSDAGRAVLAVWTGGGLDVGGLPNRSLLYERVAPLLDASDPERRADGALLRDAFDDAYHRAIALGEHCLCNLPVRRQVRRGRETDALPDGAPLVRFPTRFELRLGLMGGEEWQRFADEAAQALTAWWETRDVAALQEVGDLLDGRTPEPGEARGGRARVGGWGEPEVTRIQRYVRAARGAGAEAAAAGGMSAAASVAGQGMTAAFVAGAAGALAPTVLAAVVGVGRAAGRLRAGDLRGSFDVVELPGAGAARE
jgi:hypothetical protein